MIPVVDLFAGPGGLGEGFGSLRDNTNEAVFDIRSSFEKELIAHRTLSLRAFYRAFGHPSNVPPEYYDYLRGKISREVLLGNPRFQHQADRVMDEAYCYELGVTPAEEIDEKITRALMDDKPWVLIGGPPCQVYSHAGRSRWRRENVEKFENDHRHFLYKEYLRIIQKFRPAVFVMENVRGILSSTNGGNLIFQRIIDDLSNPCQGLRYEIRSFNHSKDVQITDPKDFIVKSENHGLPQARHRVMLLGVHQDIANREHRSLSRKPRVSVQEAIGDLPHIRSMLSRGTDSQESWSGVFDELKEILAGDAPGKLEFVSPILEKSQAGKIIPASVGSRFTRTTGRDSGITHPVLASWLHDDQLDGYCQHEARSHMRSDLHRYLYAACYAKTFQESPKVDEFPYKLLPKHENVFGDNVPFRDRFRVQLENHPSVTVVSHIAKDGHYYIHYDPAQCRSLTVREAARLQTFPDNYFFEGNRTQQYWQVGNAVPPMLARQAAMVVADLLGDTSQFANQLQQESPDENCSMLVEPSAW